MYVAGADAVSLLDTCLDLAYPVITHTHYM